jgi:hypothetical protein
MYGLAVDIERCPDGVELVELPPILSVPGAHGTLAQGVVPPLPEGVEPPPTPLIFRSRTARRESERLEFTDLEDLVVIAFVNAADDERRRLFFGRFGFTTPGAQIYRDDVLQNQERLLRLLLANHNPAAAMETANEIIGAHRGSELQPVWHLAGPRGVPYVVLRSRSLLSFMLMEAASAIAYGAKLSSCQQCGAFFLVGKNTWRRSRAKFCADRCRVAAMRARQAVGK